MKNFTLFVLAIFFTNYTFSQEENKDSVEIQKMLNDIAHLPGRSWEGITIEERDHFRAGGIVLINKNEYEIFSKKLEEAKSYWGDLVNSLTEEFYTQDTLVSISD